MDDPLFEIWRIADNDGPILLCPAEGGSDEAAQLRRVRDGLDADGVIHGVWSRARGRIAAGGLHAEVIDVEVPARSVAQRVATLAGADDACGWVPEELLAAPTPAPRRTPRPKKAKAPTSAVALTRKRPTAAPKPKPKRAPAKKKATVPAREPAPTVEPQVCRSCFILRDPSQLTDGVCTGGCD